VASWHKEKKNPRGKCCHGPSVPIEKSISGSRAFEDRLNINPGQPAAGCGIQFDSHMPNSPRASPIAWGELRGAKPGGPLGGNAKGSDWLSQHCWASGKIRGSEVQLQIMRA